MIARKGVERHASSLPDLDVAGNHIALNFINTLRQDAGVALETLEEDSDVLAWIRKMGLPEPALRKRLPRGALLQSARTLRTAALSAVKQKKAGKRLRLGALNSLLADAVSHLALRGHGPDITLVREYFAASAPQFLAPVAEAVAELLAFENFDLVRACEGSGCVLWFLDRANGRPRRFCTEETCGTRMRVSAHRARQARLKAAHGSP